MPISFTEYVLPNGAQRERSISRPETIEDAAKRFIFCGGRFECEILTTGDISLTAVMDVDGEPEDIEIEVCENGPAVPAAVDRLVLRAALHVKASA